MYTPGKGAGVILGTSTTAAGVAVLPQTGMNLAVEVALVAAVALAIWAVVYGVSAKLSR